MRKFRIFHSQRIIIRECLNYPHSSIIIHYNNYFSSICLSSMVLIPCNTRICQSKLGMNHRLLSSFPVLPFCAVRGGGGGGVLGLEVRSAARWRTSLSWTIACFAGASGAFFHVF